MFEYRQVEQRLRKHVPNYDKTGLTFDDYAAGVETAVERARDDCPAGQLPHQCNPSTSVWPLIEGMLAATNHLTNADSAR